MKKIYSLALLALTTIAVNAQNLVVNGDLESWSNSTTADGFTPVSSGSFSANNFLTQSTMAHTGAFAASHASQETTQSFEATLIPVTVGNSYTLSYWYLDNSTTARSRNWSTWVNVSGTTVTAVNVDDAVLHDTEYTTESALWMLRTVTVTAPAGVTHLRLQIRTYKQDNIAGGAILYDDLSVIDNTLGTKSFGISGLKVYPNPVTNGVLYISSDNAASKQVSVFDVLGKQVINTTVSNQAVNVSNLKNGVYIVKITEEGKTATRKLVIK